MQIDAPARDGEANAALVDFISSVISCFPTDFYTVIWTSWPNLPRCRLVVPLDCYENKEVEVSILVWEFGIPKLGHAWAVN